ncbi:MAG: alpha-amylase family glycosyl hydrolase [Salinivirgaceae bacterium]|jgi:glycosidase|nr:alpha-amylase family glycosyl hydrolase [Salinivirgaceae bacterium]
MNYRINIFFSALAITLFFSCSSNAGKKTEISTSESSTANIEAVEWSKNSNIYEVNIRQYTPEGTFAAFENHMPRLKEMGVDILWLMPIHPISEKNRKGTMGSYYAVADYQKTNPEFGTLNDLKHLVSTAHEMGMKVIIDWVANHTGWDNWLISEHADWYTSDSTGNIICPLNTDWSDVADLNYDVPEMREYMIQSLEYWVKEANIDGYRCDVAGMVPIDFWVDARTRLDAIKPLFMLAEHEGKEVLEAFDMIYAWEFHHIMNGIAKGEKTISDIDAYYAKIDTIFDVEDYLMTFTSNHDENSWNGTAFERMGDAVECMAVFSATVPGMPLIYSGQEDELNKRLKFFEKDVIEWGEFEFADMYSKLLKLKKNNSALWNGHFGGTLKKLENSNPEQVYTFIRKKDENEVVVALNFSDKAQSISISGVGGSYVSLFTGEETELTEQTTLELKPWGYMVLSK